MYGVLTNMYLYICIILMYIIVNTLIYKVNYTHVFGILIKHHNRTSITAKLSFKKSENTSVLKSYMMV